MGADVEHRDEECERLLWLAPFLSRQLISVFARAALLDCASALEAPAARCTASPAPIVGCLDRSLRARDGSTALMLAAMNGHKSTVERLIAAGADLDAMDIHGYDRVPNAPAIHNPIR